VTTEELATGRHRGCAVRKHVDSGIPNSGCQQLEIEQSSSHDQAHNLDSSCVSVPILSHLDVDVANRSEYILIAGLATAKDES
jgi:hypothetical protein